MWNALIFGNAKLFVFWVRQLHALLKGLPPELINTTRMKQRMSEGKDFVISAPKSLITNYNNEMDQLSREIKSFHTDKHSHRLSQIPFEKRQIGFFIIRIAVILSILSGYYSQHPYGHVIGATIGVIVSLFQFILLPYSLFVSGGYGLETSLMLFSGHFLIFPLVKYVTDALCPTNFNFYITISPLFLFVFIAIDQIICFLCLIKTPKGETKKMSKKRIFESVWYGFLNCKTYYCVLFPLLFGRKFPVTAWILDTVLGICCMF